jgi:hypothetical protein
LRRFAPAVGYVDVDSLTAQQLFCAFSACAHREVDESVREACGGTTAAITTTHTARHKKKVPIGLFASMM